MRDKAVQAIATIKAVEQRKLEFQFIKRALHIFISHEIEYRELSDMHLIFHPNFHLNYDTIQK